MIKYATDKQLPLEIILFDSNKNINCILYKKEFDKWSNINKKVKIIYSITEDTSLEKIDQNFNNEWKGEYGRINKNMILKYIEDIKLGSSIFYIYGPPKMVKDIQTLVKKELKVPKERIIIEEFTG